ncbi:NEDD4-binding protein 2-like 1 [Engraulis encrasicolus]|uniref:NEDD4-binding protein 2-like 1 n=1 Tax=Engraulis encrasicolus TaxID=184585 RepID=UPI002FD5A13C
MDEGLDPVIIDNTNMSWQEMFPYVLMGFYRGYWIKFILRIDTFNVSLDKIVRRCPNIPRGKLERMKKRYQSVKHVYQILWDDDCNWKYRSSIDSWKP